VEHLPEINHVFERPNCEINQLAQGLWNYFTYKYCVILLAKGGFENVY
jgi:hypothetical protein